MPYYAGDHWHRSRNLRVYTRGDPGLFSFVKKAVRAVGGIVQSPLGGLAMGLIPGGGWIKTGLDLIRGQAPLGASMLGMAGGPQMPEGGFATGGTPGALAHAHATGRLRRRTMRRRRRSRRF